MASGGMSAAVTDLSSCKRASRIKSTAVHMVKVKLWTKSLLKDGNVIAILQPDIQVLDSAAATRLGTSHELLTRRWVPRGYWLCLETDAAQTCGELLEEGGLHAIIWQSTWGL
ncbi:MAG: hypothetical protein FRX49_05448 [Trebouxia sp. A1-2]|nr:MAG: hypothetical protein FRX49_05448 [Trebouxia sp. A1-2]